MAECRQFIMIHGHLKIYPSLKQSYSSIVVDVDKGVLSTLLHTQIYQDEIGGANVC